MLECGLIGLTCRGAAASSLASNLVPSRPHACPPHRKKTELLLTDWPFSCPRQSAHDLAQILFTRFLWHSYACRDAAKLLVGIGAGFSTAPPAGEACIIVKACGLQPVAQLQQHPTTLERARCSARRAARCTARCTAFWHRKASENSAAEYCDLADSIPIQTETPDAEEAGEVHSLQWVTAEHWLNQKSISANEARLTFARVRLYYA